MKIKEYISNLKDIYTLLLQYLENGEEPNDDYDNLISFLTKQKMSDNHSELANFFRLLNKIYKNYCNNSNIHLKIEKIIMFYENSIKQSFTNIEIFDIFKNSKQLLLLLIKNEIINIDQNLADIIAKKLNKRSIIKDYQYRKYFYSEIEPFLDEKTKQLIKDELLKEDPQIFENFDQKRQNGVNDSFICQLIRNDSVKEFIIHVNQTNLSLSSSIPISIFETNPFLINKEVTLIEYATFYGSIQIFQYLKMNNVDLSPSLWLYAIHSKNPELIHILEENQIQPKDKSFKECFIEAIKCHHNDIADYIKENLLDENIEYNFYDNILAICFRYRNFKFFPEKYENNFLFYFACQYNYLTLVKLLLTDQEFDLNALIILLSIFL